MKKVNTIDDALDMIDEQEKKIKKLMIQQRSLELMIKRLMSEVRESNVKMQNLEQSIRQRK